MGYLGPVEDLELEEDVVWVDPLWQTRHVG